MAFKASSTSSQGFQSTKWKKGVLGVQDSVSDLELGV